MKDVRLVLCDIDGTLIVTGQPLSARAKDVLNRLHEHGVLVGIASGRSVDQQLIHQADQWNLGWQFDVVIGMNGGELWDGLSQKRSDYFKLKKEWIKEIVELMAPFDLNPFMYYHDVMLCLREDEAIKRSSFRNQIKAQYVKDVSEFWAEDNAKIMFRMKEEQMPEVEAYVASHPSPDYHAFKTQVNLIEFCDRRINKSVSMLAFCKEHDLPIESVMAFGDMSNDRELLKEAGWGVCLLNGSDDTKACADEITEKSCEEDGFADYVEKHILIPRGW
ncbi:MAG: HAD family phosphatase [Erysipelotrichaceae bacterium]|nr:HAD family phosphatase [Erysipelotrichaceae bacterium]